MLFLLVCQRLVPLILKTSDGGRKVTNYHWIIQVSAVETSTRLAKPAGRSNQENAGTLLDAMGIDLSLEMSQEEIGKLPENYVACAPQQLSIDIDMNDESLAYGAPKALERMGYPYTGSPGDTADVSVWRLAVRNGSVTNLGGDSTPIFQVKGERYINGTDTQRTAPSRYDMEKRRLFEEHRRSRRVDRLAKGIHSKPGLLRVVCEDTPASSIAFSREESNQLYYLFGGVKHIEACDLSAHGVDLVHVTSKPDADDIREQRPYNEAQSIRAENSEFDRALVYEQLPDRIVKSRLNTRAVASIFRTLIEYEYPTGGSPPDLLEMILANCSFTVESTSLGKNNQGFAIATQHYIDVVRIQDSVVAMPVQIGFVGHAVPRVVGSGRVYEGLVCSGDQPLAWTGEYTKLEYPFVTVCKWQDYFSSVDGALAKSWYYHPVITDFTKAILDFESERSVLSILGREDLGRIQFVVETDYKVKGAGPFPLGLGYWLGELRIRSSTSTVEADSTEFTRAYAVSGSSFAPLDRVSLECRSIRAE